MKMEKEHLIYYHAQAKKELDAIKSHYDEVIQFTRPYYSNEYTIGLDKNSKHSDMFILNVVEDFTNYILNTLLPRGSHWGKLEIDEDLLPYIQETDNKVLQRKKAEEVKKLLEDANEKVFKAIDSSNYFDEVYNSVWDCVTLGTGVIKISDTKNITKPIIFENESYENVSFLEDCYGKIKYVFRMHKMMNYDKFSQKFPFAKWVNDDKRPEFETEILEIIVPDGDKYRHMVFHNNFDEVLFEEVLDYNPFIIFRFRKHDFTSYGIGQGLWCLDYFKDLEEATRLDREQIANVITPALIGYGDKTLFDSLKVKAGTINFGGIKNHPSALHIEQIIPDARINVLKEQIERIKADIQKAFFVNPLGDVEESQSMTATEVQIRSEQFRNTFAGVYERLVMELLEPIITNTLYILTDNKVTKISDKKFIEISKVVFINAISENSKWKEVDKLLRVFGIAGQILGQEQATILINQGKLRDFLVDNTGVLTEPLNTNEEIEAILQERMQMAQAQIQMQMGAMENGTQQQGTGENDNTGQTIQQAR